MKTILFGLVLTLGVLSVTKADTLDYCRVFYNKSEKIADFVLSYAELTIDIKLKSINSTDSITVYYYSDTPCSDCETSLIVEDETGNRILVDSKKGSFSGHTFSVKSLVDDKKSMKVYKIYYTRGVATEQNDKLLLLFKIKLH